MNLGFFNGLLDFNFDRFVTIKFAQFFYMVSVVFNLALWLIITLCLFILAGSAGVFFVILGILSLLFGWMLALLGISVARVIIELTVASIRTAQNTTALLQAAER